MCCTLRAFLLLEAFSAVAFLLFLLHGLTLLPLAFKEETEQRREEDDPHLPWYCPLKLFVCLPHTTSDI